MRRTQDPTWRTDTAIFSETEIGPTGDSMGVNFTE